MKIYTKTGDTGFTKLGNGDKVSKTDLSIQAGGSVDELNSILGIIVADADTTVIAIGEELHCAYHLIRKIQSDLFNIGAELCLSKHKYETINEDIVLLENRIDFLTDLMKPLKNFILPGGNKSAAWYHYARTVCRRAERDVITYLKWWNDIVGQTEKINPGIIVYLNRLSDLLFVIARYENEQGKNDVVWNQKEE